MKTHNHLREVLLVLLLFSLCRIYGQVDVITAEEIAPRYSYEAFRNVKVSSSVIYAGRATREKGNLFRLGEKSGMNDPSKGIVVTASEQYAKSIKMVWSGTGRQGGVLEVYVNSIPYKEKEFVSGNDKEFTWGKLLMKIEPGDTVTYSFPQKLYKYIAIRSKGGSVQLKAVHLSWTKLLRNTCFEKPVYKVMEGDTFESPKLNIEEVAYSASNPNVATVDSETGKVSIVGCGSTTISAFIAETDKYQADTASYTLMVNPNREVYTSVVDLNDARSWFPDIPLGKPLPHEVYLTAEDVEVKVTAGTNPTEMVKVDGKIVLKMPNSTLVEVSVPKGFDIERCKFDFIRVKGKDTSTPAQKTQTLGKYAYRILLKDGIYAERFSLDYRGTYNLKIGKAGHATFSGVRPYVMPEGLKGGTVSVDEGRKVARVSYGVSSGDVVGAQEALVLKGAPGEYTLLPADGQGSTFESAGNRLRPALTNGVITAPQACRLYVLAIEHDKLGFYWQDGSDHGDAVRNMGNKAYLELPVPEGGGVQGYRLDLGESTGLEDVNASVPETAEIYTLAGVRVNLPESALPRGLYIIKGKKVYVK